MKPEDYLDSGTFRRLRSEFEAHREIARHAKKRQRPEDYDDSVAHGVVYGAAIGALVWVVIAGLAGWL